MRLAALQAAGLLLLCLWVGQPVQGRQLLAATDGGPTGQGALRVLESLRRVELGLGVAAAAAAALPLPPPSLAAAAANTDCACSTSCPCALLPQAAKPS